MEVLLAPWAKINLFLEISGKDNNNYHNLQTMIQPVALFDQLKISTATSGLKVSCRAGDIPQLEQLPEGSENIAFQAAEMFFKKIDKSPNVIIEIIKNIPVAAGLGGGSSNAAAVLNGLNQLHDNLLTVDQLCELAVVLGMDVPSFLEPRPVYCSGRGEIIKQRLTGMKFWVVLVNAGRRLATARVYQEWDNLKNKKLVLTRKDSQYNILRFLRQYNTHKLSNIIIYIFNSLENSAINICPEILQIKKVLDNAGVIKNVLSGSGPTVCGIAANESDALNIARKVKEKLGPNYWIKVVSTLQ